MSDRVILTIKDSVVLEINTAVELAINDERFILNE